MPRIAKARPIEFKYHSPQAKKVSLAGSFNDWNSKELSAKKDSQGNWLLKTSLKPGRYEYKFVVDGSWINDPKCTNCTYNSFGTQNCIIEVK